MKKENHFIFLMAILISLIPVIVLAWPIPDTEQSKCYDQSKEITCPNPGEPFYGQDSSYAIYYPSYTKLDENGEDLPDSAKSWVMVRDNITGLIWEVKQDRDGAKNYDNPHDGDNSYTWYDPTAANPGTPGDGTDTKDFIDSLKDARFGGFNDWRIPSMLELSTIDDRANDSILNKFFNGSPNSWSNNTDITYNGRAWYMRSGPHIKDEPRNKNESRGVIAVRGGTPEPSNRFVDNGDGSVTDTFTGLVWQQKTPDNTYTWKEALAYAEDLTLAGQSDWRIPTIRELESLVDYKSYEPTINASFFPDTFSAAYWSSTTSDYYTYTNMPSVWGINFSQGNDTHGLNKGDHYYLRAVRGGKIEEVSDDSGGGGGGGCFISDVLN